MKTPNPNRCDGFTLIELMVTIAVMAILLGIAVPSFNNATLNSKLRSYAYSLSNSATHARGEAIKRNAPVTLCVSSSGTSCGTGSWEQGWIVLFDRSEDDGGPLVLHRQESLPTDLKVIEEDDNDEITFRSTGVGATLSAFTVCRATPTPGNRKFMVSISATGRAEVRDEETTTCP